MCLDIRWWCRILHGRRPRAATHRAWSGAREYVAACHGAAAGRRVGAAERGYAGIDRVAGCLQWAGAGLASEYASEFPRGRYYDARAFDTWTNVIYSSITHAADQSVPAKKLSGKAARAARLAAQHANLIAFVPAGYTGTLPDGVTRVETPTRYVWLSIRVRVNGQRDVREARKLQTAMTIEAPSADKTSAATAGSAWPNVTASTPTVVTGAVATGPIRSMPPRSSRVLRRRCRTIRRRRMIRMPLVCWAILA